jgi:hypothetical protein
VEKNKQTSRRKTTAKPVPKKEQKACHLNVTVITINEQELTAGGTVLTMNQSWCRITKYQRPLSSRNKRALLELTVGCSW